LRFSVRGLIVVVLVIGAGLGWIVREAHIQRDAVAAIKKSGAGVAYSWAWRDGNNIPGGEPWAPRWLVDFIGVDYFSHVTVVVCHYKPGAPDAAIAEIGRLTQLEHLNLSASPVTDAGLVRLKGLTKLSVLGLAGTQVTDAGLAHLKGLTNLNYLDLSGTQISDAGLLDLKGLTKLSTVDLRGTQVAAAGMNELNRALPRFSIRY
jgi:Leucine-rich repeat (LRR) protein